MSRPERTAADIIKCAERMIIASGKRTAWEDPAQLAQLVALADTLAAAVQTAVDGQRASGFTWASIGEATGTTAPAAHQKWAKREAA